MSRFLSGVDFLFYICINNKIKSIMEISEKQEKHIETIKKLLQFTSDNGASENEVLVALTKASALMKKHNISEDMVIDKSDDNFINGKLWNSVERGEPILWLRTLTSTIAQMYQCKISWLSNPQHLQYYNIYGSKFDVQTVETIMQKLIPIVRMLKNAAYEQYVNDFCKENEEIMLRNRISISFLKKKGYLLKKPAYTVSYMLGFAKSVHKVLEESQIKESVEIEEKYSLMCIDKLELVNQYMEKADPTIKSVQMNKNVKINGEAYYKGVNDGKTNFMTQEQIS